MHSALCLAFLFLLVDAERSVFSSVEHDTREHVESQSVFFHQQGQLSKVRPNAGRLMQGVGAGSAQRSTVGGRVGKPGKKTTGAKESTVAHAEEVHKKGKTGDHSEVSLPAIGELTGNSDDSGTIGFPKGSSDDTAARDDEAQVHVKTGDHSEASLPAIEDKSAEAGVSHGVERPDAGKVPGGCQLGWPKKCAKGFVECGDATDQKKCGVFKKDFQKLCCAEENPGVSPNKDDEVKVGASKKGGDSAEVRKNLGGCSFGSPKKCKKGDVECGEATEEKQCGVFKKDFQKFCCAGGVKDESEARVSHAGEKEPGGCRLGWPKKCKKGFVECGEAKDEKMCGLFKKDFQKLCCGEDDPKEPIEVPEAEEEEKPEGGSKSPKVKIMKQAAQKKDWWDGGDGPIQPWYDVDGIKSNGPVQDQLKSLLTELGEHQPAMVQANEEMAGEVDKNIKSWTNSSKALQDSHHVFSEAGDAFRDKTWDMHRIMTTITQRHMKWQGKPVKEGPLGDAVDGVGPEDMQNFVKNNEDEPDMPPALGKQIFEKQKGPTVFQAAVPNKMQKGAHAFRRGKKTTRNALVFDPHSSEGSKQISLPNIPPAPPLNLGKSEEYRSPNAFVKGKDGNAEGEEDLVQDTV